MSGMTRKHFNAFAKDIKSRLLLLPKGGEGNEGYRNGLEYAAQCFADLAKQDNPNFDRARFMQACGFEE